jgi:hypothetical protein
MKTKPLGEATFQHCSPTLQRRRLVVTVEHWLSPHDKAAADGRALEFESEFSISG